MPWFRHSPKFRRQIVNLQMSSIYPVRIPENQFVSVEILDFTKEPNKCTIQMTVAVETQYNVLVNDFCDSSKATEYGLGTTGIYTISIFQESSQSI